MITKILLGVCSYCHRSGLKIESDGNLEHHLHQGYGLCAGSHQGPETTYYDYPWYSAQSLKPILSQREAGDPNAQ